MCSHLHKSHLTWTLNKYQRKLTCQLQNTRFQNNLGLKSINNLSNSVHFEITREIVANFSKKMRMILQILLWFLRIFQNIF